MFRVLLLFLLPFMFLAMLSAESSCFKTIKDTNTLSAYNFLGEMDAFFYYPDTVCQFDCLMPTELNNSMADVVHWTIIGPDQDTVLSDDLQVWCFDAVGVYQVKQEVWGLNYADVYQRSVRVLSRNFGLSAEDEVYLCQDIPQTLTVSANRPIQTYLWSNGSQQPNITINQPGDYSLIATDGYCVDSLTIKAILIEEILTEDILFVPSDTIVCSSRLPYELRPSSAYSSVFFINNDTLATNTVFEIKQAGEYTVNALIGHCVFSEQINLILEDCSVPIYLPNVFSPNNDGHNDSVFPQGKDFQGILLQVFDRWGSLVFETQAPPFSWDGRFGAEMLAPATYVLVFTYLNQRNLQQEVVSQDVLLLR